MTLKILRSSANVTGVTLVTLRDKGSSGFTSAALFITSGPGSDLNGNIPLTSVAYRTFRPDPPEWAGSGTSLPENAVGQILDSLSVERGIGFRVGAEVQNFTV